MTTKKITVSKSEEVELPQEEETKKTKKPTSTKKSTPKKEPIKQEKEETLPVDTDPTIDANNFLDYLNIDLDKMVIVEKPDTIDNQKNINKVLNFSMPAREIVLHHSGYKAEITPLTTGEIFILKQGEKSLYKEKHDTYSIIYNHLKLIGIPMMSFETWLQNTSLLDYEELCRGLYEVTYPEPITLRLACGNKTKPHYNEYRIHPKDLERNNSGEINIDELEDSIKFSADHKTNYENSLFRKVQRIALEKTKLIVDIKEPSLQDVLNIYELIPTEEVENLLEIISYFIYVSAIYIPTFNKETNKVNFIKETNKDKLFSIVRTLQPLDFNKIEEACDEANGKLLLSYQTPSKKICSTAGCNTPVERLEVSFSEILFQKVYYGRRR